jgi:hypothetical protein
MTPAARGTIAAMLLLVSTSAIAAGTTAGFEMGGRYGRFDPVVGQYNQSGELFPDRRPLPVVLHAVSRHPQCLHQPQRDIVVSRGP